MGCVKELTAKMVEIYDANKNAILEKNIEISKMETRLSDKNGEIYQMETRLSDKNNEITKKDVEIAHMENKIRLTYMLEKAGIIV
jgi:uncharacterized protein (DUF3084 family)